MQSESLFSSLCKILEERGIDLHEDLERASPPTREALAAWSHEYLSPATLLTKEEHDLYEKLGGPKNASAIQPSTEDPSRARRPLADEELDAAIDVLQSSTAAIERQCHLLELQKQALLTIQARNKIPPETARTRERRVRQHAREKAELDVVVDELARSVRYEVDTGTTDAESAFTSLVAFVGKQLAVDGRLLADLEALAPQLQESNASSVSEEQVEEWCRVLVLLRAKNVRNLVERSYASADLLDPEASHQDAVATVREELDTLLVEVESVIQVVVDQEFRRPILEDLQRTSAAEAVSRAERQRYVLACLEHVAIKLEALTTHARDLHDYRAAFAEIARALSAELHEIGNTQASQKRNKTAASAPQNTGVNKGLKELILVRNNLAEPQNPIEQLLRHFDIRPNRTKAPDTSDVPKQLATAVVERAVRLRDLADSTSQTGSAELSNALMAAESDLQTLLRALYVHSEYGSIHLADPRLQGTLEELSGQVREVSESAAGLRMEDAIARLGDRLGGFVERWRE
ncbi:hypothetical protein LTR66_011319 [Elasticomyces elasticus]|nr:hypothetical protein LTR66_011319 [Elasticomyces elasticus]